jgi:hypothetical protein
MRKPRDYDSELKALDDKAKQLRARKVQQLGELLDRKRVRAGCNHQLAGAMLTAAETKDAPTKEAWRKRGTSFFQGAARSTAGNNRDGTRGTQTNARDTIPASGDDRA